MRVDLNADVGEGMGADAALMPFLSSANVACGAHAGDRMLMRETIACAQRHTVVVGAHPGFADRENFGRRELQMTPAEVTSLVEQQIEALAEAAAEQGVRLAHVKPHGALYNIAARESTIAAAIARAVVEFDRSLLLFGLAGSRLIDEGRAAGLRTASEVFADRGYRADGSLVPRGEPGAVIEDEDIVVHRALSMVRDRVVVAVDGTHVPLDVDTICIHGDTPGAAELARSLRAAFATAGVVVMAPG